MTTKTRLSLMRVKFKCRYVKVNKIKISCYFNFRFNRIPSLYLVTKHSKKFFYEYVPQSLYHTRLQLPISILKIHTIFNFFLLFNGYMNVNTVIAADFSIPFGNDFASMDSTLNHPVSVACLCDIASNIHDGTALSACIETKYPIAAKFQVVSLAFDTFYSIIELLNLYSRLKFAKFIVY